MNARCSRGQRLGNVLCARGLSGLPATLQRTATVAAAAPLAARLFRRTTPPTWVACAHSQPQFCLYSGSVRSWLPRNADYVCPRPGGKVAATGCAPPLGLRIAPHRSATASSSAPSAASTSAAATPAADATRSGAADAAAEPTGAKHRPKTRRRQQQREQRTTDGAQDDAVLFIGFHPEELDVVLQRLPELLPLAEGVAPAAADDDTATVLVDVTYDMLQYTVPEVLSRQTAKAAGAAAAAAVTDAPAAGSETGRTAVAAGRVVLLVGPAARDLGAQLNDLLPEWGVVPALIAAYQPTHEGMPLRRLVSFLRDSHAAYYGLLQPLRVEPLEPPVAVAAPAAATVDVGAEEGVTIAVPEGAEAEATEGGRVDHLSVLEDVRVVMCAAMDAGEVPSIHGAYRRDAGHVVVLDGLLTEGERAGLLDWLTAPGHDHAGPPPEDKWEMVCVDREGARPTWGLQPQVLRSLREEPPRPVVALQTRLAALYPEYDICHMPADQISGDSDPEDAGADTPLSSFVGNAVMTGDPCAWHADADPTTVPPHSPWVHNFGYYHNRELGRPLFVSMLLYLNDVWPEDYHAETLFLDPETQLGLFVRPAPGRVVLLEQDLPHRISAPSLEAPGPRYSLVWKLVMLPRSREAGGAEARDGEEEEEGGGCVATGGEFQSICRPEWGEPVRLGSANGRCGVPAFRRAGGVGREPAAR